MDFGGKMFTQVTCFLSSLEKREMGPLVFPAKVYFLAQRRQNPRWICMFLASFDLRELLRWWRKKLTTERLFFLFFSFLLYVYMCAFVWSCARVYACVSLLMRVCVCAREHNKEVCSGLVILGSIYFFLFFLPIIWTAQYTFQGWCSLFTVSMGMGDL